MQLHGASYSESMSKPVWFISESYQLWILSFTRLHCIVNLDKDDCCIIFIEWMNDFSTILATTSQISCLEFQGSSHLLLPIKLPQSAVQGACITWSILPHKQSTMGISFNYNGILNHAPAGSWPKFVAITLW